MQDLGNRRQNRGQDTETYKEPCGGRQRAPGRIPVRPPAGPQETVQKSSRLLPHLLWLATDETGDPDNCSCKLCAPDELQIESQAKSEQEPVKKEEEASWKDEAKAMNNPSVVIPGRTSAQDVSKATVAPSPSPAPSQRPSSAAFQLHPSPYLNLGPKNKC